MAVGQAGVASDNLGARILGKPCSVTYNHEMMMVIDEGGKESVYVEKDLGEEEPADIYQSRFWGWPNASRSNIGRPDMLGALQKAGTSERRLKIRRGRAVYPAGPIKSYIEVVLRQGSGGKPPFPTCSILQEPLEFESLLACPSLNQTLIRLT
jgi:hypothetical protein